MFASRRRAVLVFIGLAISSLLAGTPMRSAQSCPVEIPPQPLRTLYQYSDRIVVARVGATELVESHEDSRSVRTSLHVTRNIVGRETDPLVHVYHYEWTDNGVVMPGTYQRGDQLLVFLERRKEGPGYEVDLDEYGIKKLSDEDLDVYIARIEELDRIMKHDADDQQALLEWLVRCAEEPATRWEGAFELGLSAHARAEKNKGDDTGPAEVSEAAQDDVSTGTSVEPSEAAESEISAEEDSPQSDFLSEAAARLQPAMETNVEVPEYLKRRVKPDPDLLDRLTQEQRLRLADSLFDTKTIERGESALLHVVQTFKDSRFVPFLLAHMHKLEKDPPVELEEWLNVLTQAMESVEAGKLAGEYITAATYFEFDANEDERQPGFYDQANMEAREAKARERATKKRSELFTKLLSELERINTAAQVKLLAEAPH